MNGYVHMTDYLFANHVIAANKPDVIKLFGQRF